MKHFSTLVAVSAIGAIALGADMSANAMTTQRLTASRAEEYALIYNLPRTAVDITIEAEHTRQRTGEFANYAGLYLGINNAITANNDAVGIRSITITTRPSVDPDNRWQVQFKPGSTPYITLDESGVILAVNAEAVDRGASAPELPVAVAPTPTPLETVEARQAVTQDMARSSSTSKRAELAAQRIFQLRDMRSDLLSGQADNTPPDGHSMQLMLDNLAAQEAALTAMFAGTEQRFTTVSTLTFEPDSTDINSMTIARLSAIDGVVDADDLSGAPITLSMQIIEGGRLPIDDRGQTKRFPRGGLAYNIPGRAIITVSYDGKEVASQQVSLAQAGVVFGLDPALFTDKKNPSMVQFDPTTGAILVLGPVSAAE